MKLVVLSICGLLISDEILDAVVRKGPKQHEINAEKAALWRSHIPERWKDTPEKLLHKGATRPLDTEIYESKSIGGGLCVCYRFHIFYRLEVLAGR